MSLFFADLVREVSLGTGTGDLALGGALPGHRRFADAVPAGARFPYAIAGVTHPDEWETGEGELGSGGTLLRLPLASSAGGAAVNFSAGLKTVALSVGAAWFSGQEEGGAIGIADVEGLQAALDGKADDAHGHAIADVGGLQAALDGKAPLAAPSFTGAVNSDGEYRVDGVKVVGDRVAGWGSPTGQSSRAAFDTSAISAGQLAQRVKALIEDLKAHGLIGS